VSGMASSRKTSLHGDRILFGKSLNPSAVRAPVLSKDEMQQRLGENILKALEQSKGKNYGPDGAAAILGMKPTTLTSRMKNENRSLQKGRRVRFSYFAQT